MKLFTRDKWFYKTFFSLTVMMALQNIITYSVNLADNIMIGGYNETQLSGVALANQIQFLLQMIVVGIGGGMMVLISQYWGKRDIQSIRKIISVGFMVGMSMALILWLVIFFFPEASLAIFTNDIGVINEGTKYIKIICFSYMFFTAVNILLVSLRSVETVVIGFIISISTLIINVFLNYVLIFGNFGAPELGARGAAIATLTARVIEFVIIVVYVFFIDKKIQMRPKYFLNIDKQILKYYLRIGSPIILSDTLWGIAMAIQAVILGHMGAETIAANSIATTIFQIVTVVCYASGNASSVIVGKTIGEGRIEDVKLYAKTLQVLYLIIGLVSGLSLFLLKDFVIGVYNISESTKSLATMFTIVLSVTIIGTAYECSTLTGIVRGGGETKFVLYNDLVFMWLISLPAAALAAFVFGMSPVVVFSCLKADQILKCFVGYFKVNKGSWIRDIAV